MKFLVVDDEVTARTMLRILLEEHGEVDEAADGACAMSLVRSAVTRGEPYDLICVDLSMPGLDGHRLLERLRELESFVGKTEPCRIIVASASRHTQDIVGSFKRHADGYLTKPIQFARLNALLEEFNLTLDKSA